MENHIAKIADNAGTLKLKILVMKNTKIKFPRGINSDQVISLCLKPTGRLQGVHPGPGLKRQASSNKLREIQASSGKHQAPSSKRQA